ncbi:MAG: V-type ATPase 116kDa subunit family protein, partial [Chlamydiales bacterium]
PKMIEMRVNRSAKQLHDQQTFVKESLHLLEAELKEFAGHIDFFQGTLVELLNDYHLDAAKKEVQFPLGQTLFVVEAWIPENKVHAVFSMINGMAIQIEEIATDEKERHPTYIENKGAPRLGEDLVLIYDTPSAQDQDPSGWVFWSFIFFFALIVNDAGYGLLFLLAGLFLRYKFPKAKGMGKRLIKLTLALSVSCILWGVTTASYFGMEFSPQSKISNYSLLGFLAEKKAAYHLEKKDDVYDYWVKEFPQASSAKDTRLFLQDASRQREGRLVYETFDAFKDNILLEISLFIGVIHICLSLIRYLKRHLAGIGWIFFLIGGYLYFPSVLHCTSLLHFTGIVDKSVAALMGIQLIYGGVGIAVLLAFIQKRLKGFSEVTTLVQVFADVLSYLRLYALALAGAMMASTFNDLGKNVGLVAGVFVILLGHTVNILLAIMAGVIHGLRLNFIEWYHHSFEGGGRLLKPLKKIR